VRRAIQALPAATALPAAMAPPAPAARAMSTRTNSFTTQCSLSLPAGTFVVTATGVANSNGSAMESVDCQLLVGGTNVDQARDLFLGANLTPAEKLPISLTGAITLAAPGPAELQCESTGIGNVVSASITAIEVGTLHEAP
jgi:hypothetical protein